MKQGLLYFLLLTVVLASGCMANKNTDPIPTTGSLSGTFTGQFRRVHTTAKNGVRDTLRATIQLNLTATNRFNVTGDTSTLVAGSHGIYALNSNYIQFGDSTFSATAAQTKIHLAGIYQYYYNGSLLQMVINSPFDTLSYQYDLKKVN